MIKELIIEISAFEGEEALDEGKFHGLHGVCNKMEWKWKLSKKRKYISWGRNGP